MFVKNLYVLVTVLGLALVGCGKAANKEVAATPATGAAHSHEGWCV